MLEALRPVRHKTQDDSITFTVDFPSAVPSASLVPHSVSVRYCSLCTTPSHSEEGSAPHRLVTY
jgi:hypothetical protein